MKKYSKNKTPHKERSKGSLFIPAGLFIGIGFGFLYNKLVEGMFIGLGVGFLLFAIINLFEKKR